MRLGDEIGGIAAESCRSMNSPRARSRPHQPSRSARRPDVFLISSGAKTCRVEQPQRSGPTRGGVVSLALDNSRRASQFEVAASGWRRLCRVPHEHRADDPAPLQSTRNQTTTGPDCHRSSAPVQGRHPSRVPTAGHRRRLGEHFKRCASGPTIQICRGPTASGRSATWRLERHRGGEPMRLTLIEAIVADQPQRFLADRPGRWDARIARARSSRSRGVQHRDGKGDARRFAAPAGRAAAQQPGFCELSLAIGAGVLVDECFRDRSDAVSPAVPRNACAGVRILPDEVAATGRRRG